MIVHEYKSKVQDSKHQSNKERYVGGGDDDEGCL